MARYNIQEVTSGDWDYASDSYDLKRIVRDYLLPMLSYNPDNLTISEAYEKYWCEDEWQNCRHAPDDFKFTDDAPDYMMHVILSENPMWELTDTGRIKTLNKKMVLCAQAEDQDSHVWLDQHEIGKCPYHIYYKNVMQNITMKLDLTLYINAEGVNEYNKLENSLRDALNEYMCEDRLDDVLRDHYEYNQDEQFEQLRWKFHKNKVSKVRRIP